MSCALDKLAAFEDIDPFIESAKGFLAQAVFLMDEYYRTWNSIIWVKSNRSTKNRVQEQLNNLAFDAYTAFSKARELLDEYVDSQIEKERKGELVKSPPQWWNDMLTSLTLAESSFQKEYRHSISSKQIRLF
ncbi:MAG: hypothetical protein KME49_22505 [Brasilonema octagenarum HA4186-MV1]|jgi:cytochrome P450|nr:hypothetical protein [Brasilonema octagenarum HA4186-MV1]